MRNRKYIYSTYMYLLGGETHINWPMQFNPVLFMGQLYFKKHWEIARHVYNFTGAWDLYSVINFLYTAYKRIEPGKAILLKLHKKLKKKRNLKRTNMK